MTRRTDRLGEQFREEISKLIQKGLKDPRVSIVGLNNSAGFIRGVLGKALKIFKVPELKFVLDENLEHAMHIEEILAELKQKGEL